MNISISLLASERVQEIFYLKKNAIKQSILQCIPSSLIVTSVVDTTNVTPEGMVGVSKLTVNDSSSSNMESSSIITVTQALLPTDNEAENVIWGGVGSR